MKQDTKAGKSTIHEKRVRSMLVGWALIADCLSYKDCQQENMLCQETTHMASTTFYGKKLTPFIEEQPNCRTISAPGVYRKFRNEHHSENSWLRIPKLSEKPKILLPWCK